MDSKLMLTRHELGALQALSRRPHTTLELADELHVIASTARSIARSLSRRGLAHELLLAERWAITGAGRRELEAKAGDYDDE